jgi:hypothetical protein
MSQCGQKPPYNEIADSGRSMALSSQSGNRPAQWKSLKVHHCHVGTFTGI